MNINRYVGQLLAVLLIAALVPAPATAAGIGRPGKPAYAQWAASTVKVYVDPTVRGRGRGWNVARSLREWSAGPIRLQTVSAPCSDCITIREVPGGRSWWGEATYQRLDGVLLACDIKLGADTRRRQRRYVAAHEIGHCLGLPHINDRDSIMDLWSRVKFKIPPASDVDWLSAAYAAG